jgi:transposase
MKQDFETGRCFIGIDVAKQELVIAQSGSTTTLSVANERSAIDQWLDSLPEASVIALEATGGYHELILGMAFARGHACYLLNPRDVKHYAKGVGQRSKTDQVDARLIARYVAREHAHLHLWQPMSAQAEQLHQLLGRRNKLVQAKTALRASLQGLQALQGEVAATLQSLQTLVDKMDQLISQAVRQLPQGQQHSQRLQQVPGIGLLNAAMLTNLFLRVPFAKSDAVVAFAGLDPRANDSGLKRGKRRLSKRGPAELRRLLYNAAMAARKSPVWLPFYERQRAKGLPTTACLIVLARKLLRLAFSLFKHQTDFDPKLINIA